VPFAPSQPRAGASASFSISAGRTVSTVPRFARKRNDGTADAFWPKSTTCGTPFLSENGPRDRARSRRSATSPPHDGRITPVNSPLISGVCVRPSPVTGSATRASYSSPSKIAAWTTAPATPHRHPSGPVSRHSVEPSA